MLTLAFNIQPVKASVTIYINADGSIDPPDAPISTVDNVTYILTGNITNTNNADGIVIMRDSIIINGNGYTLQGSGAYFSNGINLRGRSNVTIQNIEIRRFDNGIYLTNSYDNKIVGNNITGSYHGIFLGNTCGNNSLNGNAFVDCGLVVSDSYHSVVADNLVNGKPLIYLEGVSDVVVEDAGQVVLVNCTHIGVENLDLFKASIGVQLYRTNNTIISGNNITSNRSQGILLNSSSSNSISGNNITNNGAGIIVFDASSGNSISGNNITNNQGGIVFDGSSGNSVSRNNITSNTEDGITLRVSSNVDINGNNVTNNNFGIYLESSSNNSVSGNNIKNNWSGIIIEFSDNNSISGNNVTANSQFGIYLDISSDNKVYHNNFINNHSQASLYSGSGNIWDNGYPSGGNFWSNFNGNDLYSGVYQNESGFDGIGDSHYIIDSINLDNYPLMKPYSGSHDIGITFIVLSKTIVGKGYCMNSSSTVINYGEGTETFNATLIANGTAIQAQNVSLSTRNSKTIPFVWNTTDYAYGNYTMSAAAQPVLGEIDLTDNNYTCNIPVHVGVPGDISGPTAGVYDGTTNMRDVQYLILLFNTKPGSPNWKPNADINNDGTVNMRDIQIAILNFNKHE
jgi:parallel beta-helix repeat protein